MNEEKILNGLNDKQKEVVLATEGKIRVIAGAGSGKTLALTRRYAYLVEVVGINPSNLLCMTFTNKAAGEMKNRISKFVSQGNYNDFICTIHSFCIKLLRRDIYRLGFPKSFSVLDEEDKRKMAKEVMKDFGMDRNNSTVKIFLCEQVDHFKAISHPYYIEKYMLPKSADENTPFAKYVSKQVKNFSIDFNDMIYMALYLLNKYSDVREFWQDELNYIMMDEAQDCNGSDWELIYILSNKWNNLFIVGDPDQAIYEWRGASPSSFMNFTSDIDIILAENYRSTPNILNVANSIIINNQLRIKKDLFTRKQLGATVIHFHGKTEEEESFWIVNQIIDLVNKGVNLSDIAILYRASYLSRGMEQALLQKDIKYSIWNGTRFFERREIKDAISYLRLIAFGDDLSFMRIVNVPSRKVGKVFIENLRSIDQSEDLSLYDSLKRNIDNKCFNKESVKKFISLIEKSRTLLKSFSVSDLLDYVLKESGLIDEIRNDGDEERLENIEELQNSIKYYEEVNKDEDYDLVTYLQDISLYTNADYKKDDNSVKLMTIHQAKGLEFSCVFVMGLSEGIFPNYKTIRERKLRGLEEERRLMYVAITRARNMLFLTESEGFNITMQTSKYPSRFLLEVDKNSVVIEGEIDNQLIECTKELVESESFVDVCKNVVYAFKVGDAVKHEIFGNGIIVKINDDFSIVKFKEKMKSIRNKFLVPMMPSLSPKENSIPTFCSIKNNVSEIDEKHKSEIPESNFIKKICRSLKLLLMH